MRNMKRFYKKGKKVSFDANFSFLLFLLVESLQPFEGPVKVLAGGKFPAVMKNVKIELAAGESLQYDTNISSFGHF